MIQCAGPEKHENAKDMIWTKKEKRAGSHLAWEAGIQMSWKASASSALSPRLGACFIEISSHTCLFDV